MARVRSQKRPNSRALLVIASADTTQCSGSLRHLRIVGGDCDEGVIAMKGALITASVLGLTALPNGVAYSETTFEPRSRARWTLGRASAR